MNFNENQEDLLLDETENQVEERVEDDSSVKEKKHKNSLLFIIVPIITIISLALGFFSFLLFDKDIKGSWETINQNGQSIILTFKKDNSVLLTIGSITQEDGSYIIRNNKDMALTIGLTGLSNSGETTYSISGNMISGKVLTINYGDNQQMVLKNVDYDSIVNPFNDFKTLPQLIGTWIDSTGYFEYTFQENGIYIMRKNSLGSFVIKGAYSVEGNTLKRNFLVSSTGEEKIVSDEFSLSNNILTIDDIKMTKIK